MKEGTTPFPPSGENLSIAYYFSVESRVFIYEKSSKNPSPQILSNPWNRDRTRSQPKHRSQMDQTLIRKKTAKADLKKRKLYTHLPVSGRLYDFDEKR